MPQGFSNVIASSNGSCLRRSRKRGRNWRRDLNVKLYEIPAFGAHAREEGAGDGLRPIASSFLSRTARLRAVLSEQTTIGKP